MAAGSLRGKEASKKPPTTGVDGTGVESVVGVSILNGVPVDLAPAR
jgi:hypothetical protein